MKCFKCLLKELAEPKEATLLPLMLFFASPTRFPGAPPARSVCGLPVCEEHKPEITLDYLLTDKGFDAIVHSFGMVGKAAPERSATKLEFISIDCDEARCFMASRRRPN